LQNAFFQVLLLWEYAQKHVTHNASVKRVTVDVGRSRAYVPDLFMYPAPEFVL